MRGYLSRYRVWKIWLPHPFQISSSQPVISWRRWPPWVISLTVFIKVFIFLLTRTCAGIHLWAEANQSFVSLSGTLIRIFSVAGERFPAGSPSARAMGSANMFSAHATWGSTITLRYFQDNKAWLWHICLQAINYQIQCAKICPVVIGDLLRKYRFEGWQRYVFWSGVVQSSISSQCMSKDVICILSLLLEAQQRLGNSWSCRHVSTSMSYFCRTTILLASQSLCVWQLPLCL